MQRRAALVTILLAASTLALPLAAHAAVIPFFGPIIPENVDSCALGWGAAILVINNIISLLLTLLIVFVAPLVIAYAGFLLVAYSVNPSGKERARSLITNLIVGFVIALAAWLIVNFIMVTLTGGGKIDGKSWFDIITSGGKELCLDLTVTPPVVPSGGVPGAGGITTTQPPGSTVGGACQAPASSGVCSEAYLKNTCFSLAAVAAAQVCMTESSGIPDRVSGSDKLNGGTGPAYSIGLYQINITNSFNTRVNGRSCAEAFSAPCQGSALLNQQGSCSSTIKDQALYDACVAAAKTATININEACRLSSNGRNWSRWKYTANACNLPT